MKVVYVDVLFVINLCMDFLALRVAGGVLHLPARRLPLFLASALGGSYAILTTLYPGNAILSAIIGGFAAALITVIGYGGTCRRGLYPWLILLFYGASWLLGGAIGAFYSFLERFFEYRGELLDVLTEGDGKIAFFFAVILALGVILGLLRERLSTVRQERSVNLRVTVGKSVKEIRALVDSGNLLKDPMSGRPCLLLTLPAARGLIPSEVLRFSEAGATNPEGLGSVGCRIRLIPADSVGGHSLLVGYLPDKVELLLEKGERATDAMLAVTPGRGDFSGYGALIPSILI